MSTPDAQSETSPGEPPASLPALPTLGEVRDAAGRIAGKLHRTPLWRSETLSKLTGLDLHLKCELFQKTGSFKPRGGINRVATLSDEARARGVITISAGNNAQGIAFAARVAGIPAVITMPKTASTTKVAATRDYGAEVVLEDDTGAAFATAAELARTRGLTLIHPFDDRYLIAGHGTLALETANDLPEINAVVCGVGGGGMIGGVATTFADTSTTVYGVEPSGAPTMTRALEKGEPVRLDTTDTIADGLAPPFVGELNLAIAQAHVEKVVLVEDNEIVAAMKLLLERTKMLVEPAGAAALAALLSHRLELEAGARVVVVLSGGNVDLPLLARLLA